MALSSVVLPKKRKCFIEANALGHWSLLLSGLFPSPQMTCGPFHWKVSYGEVKKLVTLASHKF